MSLINRMLRDLNARERPPGDALSGITVPSPQPLDPPGPNWSRLALLLVLVAAFTLTIWLLLPRPARQASAPGSVTASAPTTPAPGSFKYQLDTTLSPVTTPPQLRKRAEARRDRPAEPPQAPLRLRAEPAVTTASIPDTPTRPPPPAAATRPRDAKAAAARYAEARAARARGDEGAAAIAYAAALELDPQLHAAREDFGTLRVRQGRMQEAESLMKDGLALDPDWVGYRRLAARIELGRNNAAAAASMLERNPPTAETDPEYHGLLASAYQRLERHNDAARIYGGLTRLQPNESHWWAGYGLSRDALGDAPGALAAYSQARSLGGLDTLVLDHINRRAAALTAGE